MVKEEFVDTIVVTAAVVGSSILFLDQKLTFTFVVGTLLAVFVGELIGKWLTKDVL